MQKWETAESNLVNEEEANLENRRPEFEQGPLDAMDAFVAALNARDDEALYHTIHLPHFRISADGVLIYPTLDELKKSYLQDFFARAGTDWGHTIFDSKDVIHSSENKAHVFLQFTRYDSSGSNIGTFRSLWIMTRVDGKWGVGSASPIELRTVIPNVSPVEDPLENSPKMAGKDGPPMRLLPLASGIST